jgi:hypothetical protein
LAVVVQVATQQASLVAQTAATQLLTVRHLAVVGVVATGKARQKYLMAQQVAQAAVDAAVQHQQ